MKQNIPRNLHYYALGHELSPVMHPASPLPPFHNSYHHVEIASNPQNDMRSYFRSILISTSHSIDPKEDLRIDFSN